MTAQQQAHSRGAHRASLKNGATTLAPAPMPLAQPAKQERHWRHRLGDIIGAFAGKRILVLGDMIADEYLVGMAERMSREAPIPVISQRERYIVPGGALNPAVNVRMLGAEVHVMGIVGDDDQGQRLRQRMSEMGISHDLLLTESGRPTSTKTRIMASNGQSVMQHVARIDSIDTTPPDAATIHQMIDALATLIPTVDGIILSDYDNGLMVLPLIDAAIRLAYRHDRVTVADARSHLSRFQGVTAITPNQAEAEEESGIAFCDLASLDSAGALLLEGTQTQGVLITRGGEGMSLYQRDGSSTHIPAFPSEVRDTTGAGDTVAATFTLGLATGAAMRDAATIANVAASLVVRRLGCATTTPDELLHAVASLEASW